MISLGLNYGKETDVGLLSVIVSCWFRQENKNLTTTVTYSDTVCFSTQIFKVDLFFIHHDVTIICVAPLFKTQQFFTATVVRKSLVALG